MGSDIELRNIGRKKKEMQISNAFGYAIKAETKESVLKKLQKNYLKQKREMKKNERSIMHNIHKDKISSELQSIIETNIPKLQYHIDRSKTCFTSKELNKIYDIVNYFDANAVGTNERFRNTFDIYTFLNRFPYILKYDFKNEIIPRIDGINEIFPNYDKFAVLWRAPELLDKETSFYLNKRDKIGKIFNLKNNDLIEFILHKQPRILCDSILKTIYPKCKFLYEKCKHQREFILILKNHPNILKCGWGRLARIEFLRSRAVPADWKHATVHPPILKNIDLNYDETSESKYNTSETKTNNNVNNNNNNNQEWSEMKEKIYESRQKQEDSKASESDRNKKVSLEEKTNQERTWYLHNPAIKWNHNQMLVVFPKYISFLKEMTLRAKQNELWTMNDLKELDTRQMEMIVGNTLKQKYLRKTKIIVKQKMRTKMHNEKVSVKERMALKWNKKQKRRNLV